MIAKAKGISEFKEKEWNTKKGIEVIGVKNLNCFINLSEVDWYHETNQQIEGRYKSYHYTFHCDCTVGTWSCCITLNEIQRLPTWVLGHPALWTSCLSAWNLGLLHQNGDIHQLYSLNYKCSSSCFPKCRKENS